MGPEFTGIGQSIEEITNIASEPKCSHVIVTPTVAQIAALTEELLEASCAASAQVI